MKNVLIITYYYPPVGRGHTIRTVKFLKYFHYFGINPVVVTSRDQVPGNIDSSLASQVPPNVKIYRVFSRNIAGSTSGTQSVLNSMKKPNGFTPVRPQLSLIGKIKEQIKTFIKTWVIIPDIAILWAPFAIARSLWVIRAEKIDVIYTTCPPPTNHLVGYILKKITGKPLIVDYRDRWNGLQSRTYPPSRKRFEQWLEKHVLMNADKIICVTSPMVDEFLKMHPTVKQSKYLVITNGYDPEDFMGIDVNPTNKFLISFSGIFWKKSTRTPDNFLKAFSQMLQEHPEIKDDIEVLFMGEFLDESMHLIDGLPVKVLGFVSHEQSIRYTLQSNMTLLFLYEDEDGKMALATKFFESIAARKPVLVMGPMEGITADLMRREGLGRLTPPDDVIAIKDALYAMYKEYRYDGLKIDEKVLRQFDRKELTGQLAATINEISR